MGRKIVEDESRSDPGMRSGLWKKDDILYVLQNKRVGYSGTEKIEAIDISCLSIDSMDVDMESFAGMSQLRMLPLGNATLGGEHGHFPRTLKWLNWNPPYSLPNILPHENIVLLYLSKSCITQVWDHHRFRDRFREAKYDVFLSFRGLDTRTTFTDHLYQALRRNGVHVFRDSEGLHRGDRIEDLLGVIDRSEIFIPIFSRNYAHSKWCLKEIQKMVKVASVGESKRLILPVFYDITPEQVKHQKPPFEAAFRVHEQDEEVEAQTVKEWRQALQTASGFSGYASDGHHEAWLVDEIVERVLQEVKSYPQDAVEQLVGIKKRANDVIKELDLNSKDARMVVIHGIGGLGKTTVGRAVYDKIKTRFKFHCFIEGISKKTAGPEGLVNIQRDLVFEISKDRRTICSTGEGTEQVQALAGKWAWFQQGSRIIVTTRDKGTLALPDWERHKIYMLLTPLDENESLQLFSWHAFGKNSPADGYEELSLRIVRALEGLPLAIKILASTLYDNGDAKDQWDEGMIMRSLKGLSDDRLYTTLKVSYDRLTDSDQRSIFLDVACFFSGIDQETAIHIWDACGFSSRLSIKALIHKSLIKIINDKLEMPKILQEMGRRIVEEEPGTGPEWRSRLWKQQDIMDVLKQRKVTLQPSSFSFTSFFLFQMEMQEHLEQGTSKIEAIGLIKGNDKAEREEHDNVLINAPNHDDDTESDDKRLVEAADFASMDRLRLLMINHVDLKGRCRRMPKRIKLLQWQRCPFKSLPPDFHLKEVVALDLSYSSIVKVKRNQGWPTRRIAIFLASLMSLPLMFLTFLTSTAVPLPTTLAPFVLLCLCLVSATPEKLIERRMVKEIIFEKLKVLDLTACNELTITPDLSASPGLEKLVLDRCDNLVKIHESIALLKKLVLLSMSRCKKLKELPDCIGKLGSLVVLDASNCPKLKEAGERERVLEPEGPKVSLSDLLNWMLQSDSQVSNTCSVDESVMAQDKRLLEKLYLSGTSIRKLPFSICFLQERLRTLHLNDCKLLAEVPEWIAGLCLLEDLSISNCPSITGLPNAIGSLKKLQRLNLSHCNGIEVLPDSIGGLESLNKLLLENTSLVELPESVGCLGKLTILHLGSCKQLERLPSSIGKLGDLTELHVDGTNINELLPSSIASLQKLQLLSVRGCRGLEHLPTGLREGLTVLREEPQAKKRIK
ncbi:Plant intracellular Ras-group-related LRR protein 7 [Nymphaea thermarum]|nr:Plant intracellular Ras-group-related LRR protein 7 [Nymphaea thermarum]